MTSDAQDLLAAVHPGEVHELPDLRGRQEHIFRTLRAQAPSTIKFRSDQELEASFREVVADTDLAADVFVFGYGSLMWNPGVRFVRQISALVRGWHRSFCLRMVVGRGSVDQPGLMAALEPGGSCRGLLMQIPSGIAETELRSLWRREMSTYGYRARWVMTQSSDGPMRALTFVINADSERYLRGHPLADAARMVRTGVGSLGSCRFYFERTVQTLRGLGATDSKLEQLGQAIAEADAAALVSEQRLPAPT